MAAAIGSEDELPLWRRWWRAWASGGQQAEGGRGLAKSILDPRQAVLGCSAINTLSLAAACHTSCLPQAAKISSVEQAAAAVQQAGASRL